MLRVLSIFGTRPEAVKMAPVVKTLAATPSILSRVCVTAQHRQMLDQVLEVFDIHPDIDLNLMRPNQSLAQLTAEIFTHLDPVIAQEKPDWVLVQGDTTTVMAAALLAFYHHIHVGHVEAGLRTGDRWQPFPEEINRRVAGVVADLHFAPTKGNRQNLINEGAILAARRNKKAIAQTELEDAIERVVMGPERKSRLISVEEKRILAYHEAGHAVVMNAIPEADPVQKITIVGRGQAGGLTWYRPDDDRILMSRKKMIAQLTGSLGGRAAEQIVFDDITSGASSDLESVTKIARTMVTRMGMSPELGQRVYGQKEELIFLGREISEQRDYSEAVAELIDNEVRKLVDDAYTQAKKILTKYRTQLDEVATKLLEVENLNREEFEKIFPPPFPKKSGTPQVA